MHSLLIYRALGIFVVIFVLQKCDLIEQKSTLASSAYNFERKPTNRSNHGLNISMNAAHMHSYAF
ncbi:hypothetical protein LC20_02345 [Yersinia hibernica]|uniref:Uncharacterized protein n=1 Tax=Yersinia enterocolitica LC20 TaxID=1443113 RepID=A0A7U4K164_YEREN|nr:hypothetical protein LC20_02345 [Yersinia hibernica]OVZ91663.1 hypothetical protein CBW54_05445 [Yersinia kristensenii]